MYSPLSVGKQSLDIMYNIFRHVSAAKGSVITFIFVYCDLVHNFMFVYVVGILVLPYILANSYLIM